VDERVAAFRRVAPHLEEIDPAARSQGDACAASAFAVRALDTWQRMRPHLDAAGRILPAALLVGALRLGDLALATLFVAGLEGGGAASRTGAEAEATAAEICDDLAIAAAPLARRGLVDAAALARAREACERDRTAALEALAALFETSWDRVNGFTVVQREELARAREVARALRAAG